MPDADLHEEIRQNIDLWKHEESLRQSRNTAFLAVNAFLIAAGGALLGTEPDKVVLAAEGVTLASFGIAVCEIWRRIIKRHVAYAEFRRKQLRDLEAQTGHETWARTARAFGRKPKPVKFPVIEEEFRVDEDAATSAIALESRLPMALIVLWAFVGVASVVQLLVQ
jgi:hypothetical protein